MLDKIKKIKIFYKFLIVLLAISAVPLFVVGMRLIDINRLSLQDVTLELHTNQASQLALSIENHMKSLRDKIVFVIESQGEPPVDWALSERLLRSMLASSRDLLTVSLVNEDGREITKVFDPALEEYVKLEDRSENEVFINSRESGEASASGLMRDRYNKIPRIDIVYPFAKGIYIYIEANLEDLLEEVKNTTIGNTGFAYVVDSQGRVIMHPNEQKAIDKVSVDDRDIVQAVLSRRMAGSIEFRDPRTEKEIIGAYTPVSSFARLGWGVIIEQEYAEAYSSSIEMRKQAFILLGAVIIAACFIGYFLAQNLTAPILRLTEASRNIAAGNFDIKPVSRWLEKAKFKDEIVELSNTFSLMTRQLKRYTEMQADKMNAILFSIADGIIMTDYSGNIMLSNKKAGQLLGLDSNEELEGKKIQDIIQRQTISESLREVRKKREPVVKELDLSHENISKYLRTDTSIVSQAESDQDLGTVTVIRDITLEKELEQLKDDFVHSITHDLRSPMTSIRGFLEFLLDGSAGEINEQQKEFLQIIDRSSKRLLNMISDILDVAKMKSGNMPMEIDQVNIRQIATNVIDTMSSQAKKDKVSLSLIEKNEIKDINADNSLVGRVLTNLISNALKFTPEDGEIKVELSDEGDKVKVAVEDNGSGMPKEMCEKIFDKFEQVKGSKSKRKGTGLGLTITRYIVEAHEGKIYADSEPGKGTRVEFWIPRGLKIKES